VGKFVGHVRVMLKLMSQTIALLHCHSEGSTKKSASRKAARAEREGRQMVMKSHRQKRKQAQPAASGQCK